MKISRFNKDCGNSVDMNIIDGYLFDFQTNVVELQKKLLIHSSQMLLQHQRNLKAYLIIYNYWRGRKRTLFLSG